MLLHELADDVLEMIIKLGSTFDQLKMRRVNRKFNRLSHLVFSKVNFFSIPSGVRREDTVDVIDVLKQMENVNTIQNDGANINETMFMYRLSKFKTDIRAFAGFSDASIMSYVEFVKELDPEYDAEILENEFSVDNANELLKRNPDLKLKIFCEYEDIFRCRHKNLIHHVELIDTDQVYQELPNVKTLDVDVSWTPQQLSAQLSFFPHLTQLTCEFPNGSVLSSLFECLVSMSSTLKIVEVVISSPIGGDGDHFRLLGTFLSSSKLRFFRLELSNSEEDPVIEAAMRQVLFNQRKKVNVILSHDSANIFTIRKSIMINCSKLNFPFSRHGPNLHKLKEVLVYAKNADEVETVAEELAAVADLQPENAFVLCCNLGTSSNLMLFNY